MEARPWRIALACLSFLLLGARYQTPNFVIDAPTAELAKEIGDAAERYRKELAELWLGKTFPHWSQPCPISAKIAPHIGAGGVTTFVFDHSEVFSWNMSVQGSRERVLDSVLPHEITHTIFATHFRQPLPRWADEGACTTVEHATERNKQNRMLMEFLQTQRGIPFSAMFRLKEYPQDMLPLYAQGHSLATYLIDHGGRRKFMGYLEDGLESGDWTAATEEHYGFQGLGQLQGTWLEWVRQGSPLGNPSDTPPQSSGETVAANQPREVRPEPNLIYHGPTAERQQSLLPESRLTASGNNAGNNAGRLVPVNDARKGTGIKSPVSPVSRQGERAGAAPRVDPFSAAQREAGASESPEAKNWPDQGWRPPRQRSTRSEQLARQEKQPAPHETLPTRQASATTATNDGWQNLNGNGDGFWPPSTVDRPAAHTATSQSATAHSATPLGKSANSEGVRFDSLPRSGQSGATIRR